MKNCFDLRANLISTRERKSSQVNASARKAWPNGVTSRPKFSTCVYLRLRLARALKTFHGIFSNSQSRVKEKNARCKIKVPVGNQLSILAAHGKERNYKLCENILFNVWALKRIEDETKIGVSSYSLVSQARNTF